MYGYFETFLLEKGKVKKGAKKMGDFITFRGKDDTVFTAREDCIKVLAAGSREETVVFEGGKYAVVAKGTVARLKRQLENKLQSEERYEVVETCPHCDSEVIMKWNTDAMGFKAFCPVCGKRLMLCDECMHRTGELVDDCDFCSRTDTCRFNSGKSPELMRVVLDKDAYLPCRAHNEDAGYDLYAPYDFEVPAIKTRVKALCRGIHKEVENALFDTLIGFRVIDTGVHIELPPNTVGMIKSKSGLNVNHGLVTEGVIDEGYTGGICVKLYNFTNIPYTVKKGEKIAQLVILPVVKPVLEVVDKLSESERGNGGFGSTGR